MTTVMVDRPRPAGGTGSEMRRWNEPVDTTWHQRAACYGAGELERMLFEPVGLDEEKEDAWRRAGYAIENYCDWCPVRAQCGAEGERHVYEGVWGGAFRERRGVIDTDTGMVLRDGQTPVAPPLLELPTAPEWRVEFETVTTKRGLEQYVLLTRAELTPTG